jgi:glycosyltransferase involved in cell wall biosynthesis
MFKQHKLHLIHYTIDSDVFYCDSNTQALKIKHKIPLCNTVFLFVAENINNRRKGFDLLLESLNRLVDNNITVLLIGDSQSEFSSSIDIRLIGNINSNVKLREYYSLADAFIIPSREDNLPNVMLESLMCGTPVLCFNIGGMKDIIIDGFNGLKADKTDSNDLYNIITLFIKSKTQYNRKEIHLHALNLFSESIIVNKYKDVYDNIVNETRSGNRL